MRPARNLTRDLIGAALLAGLGAGAAGCSSAPHHAAAPPATSARPTTSAPSADVTTAGPSDSDGAGPAGTPSPSSPPPTEPVASPPPPCATSGLQGSIGRGNGAAGSIYYPLEFTNTSAADCTLYGYPGVSLVTGISGRLIGAPAAENATYPRRLVVIKPGKSAHVALQIAVAGNYPAGRCHPVTAHWLRVYPPGQDTPLYLSFNSQTCAKASVRTMFVQTVQPGSGGQ